MLLERLTEYADTLGLPPAMYDKTRIRWFIDLTPGGELLGFVPLTGEGKKGERGKEFNAPSLVRSSGVTPKLLVDNGEYVLGVARENGKPERVAEAHLQFAELIKTCAGETGEPIVAAVVRFLEEWTPSSTHLLPDDFNAGDVLTFRVDDELPIELPSVQQFWATYTAGLDKNPVMTCLVCGKEKPVQKRLPVKLKGVPGGQTSGTALISANAEAFESYGLEASLTAPTCRDCGERFAKAANALIRQEETRLTVGPVVYLFWDREGQQLNVPAFLRQPKQESVDSLLASLDNVEADIKAELRARATPADVKALLRAPATGRHGQIEVIPEEAFYATALSASGGRVVVRDWLETTVPEAKRNLARWFVLQRLVDASTGQGGTPFGIFPLAASLYRDGGDMSPQVPTVLMQSALHGRAIPDWILGLAVRRNRVEQGVTRPRATLIKMVLTTQGGGLMPEQLVKLDQEHPEVAYHCGRLLAELEAIQKAAVPGARQTLIDRYFGAASSAPASVFGVLVRNAQAHLSRLRKERKGAYEALQNRLGEIMGHIDQFPSVLDFHKQALFALGYYHQRATDRAAAIAHRERQTQNDKEES